LDGAAEALKEGLEQSPKKDTYKCWDAMAKIFEGRGDGNHTVEIYSKRL
jgi:hypothetical protein